MVSNKRIFSEGWPLGNALHMFLSVTERLPTSGLIDSRKGAASAALAWNSAEASGSMQKMNKNEQFCRSRLTSRSGLTDLVVPFDERRAGRPALKGDVLVRLDGLRQGLS